MNEPDDLSSRVRSFPIRRLQHRMRPHNRPRFQGQSFNRILPNLLTMTGLCFGLTSMRFALEGRFGPAAVAIAIAAIIDGLDGRLARLLKATSRFGAEFDSLSDFLCFGVAPGFVLYLWSLQSLGGFGYAPGMIFAVCMALRLARFNASLDGAPRPAYAYNFFTGVPAPAGAALALFPLFLGLEAKAVGWEGLLAFSRHPALCAFVLLGTAMLSVSTLPVWSFKNFKIPTRLVLPLLIGVGLYLALLLADPWAALAAGGLIYLGMLPLSLRSYLKLKREAEAMHTEAPAPTGT
jgi:CDP-diacylglycerol---serine O-phosphatidyltransferase